MIQITAAAMRYGARVLFSGLDWLISPGDRVGVVGANGAGKSTLLKILNGAERLDSGSIAMQKGIRIGYLPQDGLTLAGRTVFEECLSVFDEAVALERELEELAEKMSVFDPAGAEYQAVIDRYEWCSNRYAALDGYTKEAQVGTVLAGLAFPKEDWGRPCEEFSGGWQMRVALAKLLLEKPNLLLLDEPTNHLDLEARNWLEDYLNDYPYAFLVISHDRFFMDTTVKKIVHLWNGQAHFYAANYSQFEKLKEERLERLRAAHKNQQNRIEQLEAFIQRFRYQATKAKQVQSRIKELEKIERIKMPPEEKTIRFRFPQPRASGRVVAALEDASKSYGETRVFSNVSLHVEKGDRIALVGANGAGKSTLIRLLAGIDPPTAGARKVGHNVDVDYFAQDQYKELDPEAVLFDDLASRVPRSDDAQIRGLLGCFLFSGNDVFKKVKVLSGGERNRYALARMLASPSNFLLMDEPTNHLDLRAKDVLLQALLDFNGTLVFVSHDRYFIDRLATKVFAVGGGKTEIYPGNYEDYLWALERRGGMDEAPAPAVSAELQAALAAAGPAAAGGSQNGSSGKSSAKQRKRLNPLKAEKMRQRAAALESEIAALEDESAGLQSELAASGRDHRRRGRVISDLEARRRSIDERETEWAELVEQLDAGG